MGDIEAEFNADAESIVYGRWYPPQPIEPVLLRTWPEYREASVEQPKEPQ